MTLEEIISRVDNELSVEVLATQRRVVTLQYRRGRSGRRAWARWSSIDAKREHRMPRMPGQEEDEGAEKVRTVAWSARS